MKQHFDLLDWDSKFFGFTVASIATSKLTITEFQRIYNELQQQHVRLAYWQSATGNMSALEIAEKYNGSLVDLKTIYVRSLDKNDEETFQKRELTFYQGKTANSKLLELAFQCG